MMKRTLTQWLHACQRVLGLRFTLGSDTNTSTPSPSDGTSWYTYIPAKPINPGWYMISFDGFHAVLGHDFVIRLPNQRDFHLQIGARTVTKRLIRVERSLTELFFKVEPGDGAEHPLNVDLVRLTTRFALSRMERKLTYAGGDIGNIHLAPKSQDPQSGDIADYLFNRYDRLLERHIRKIEYNEWRTIRGLSQRGSVELLPARQVSSHQIALVIQDQQPNVSAWLAALRYLSSPQLEKLDVFVNSPELLSAISAEISTIKCTDLGIALDCEEVDEVLNNRSADYFLFVGENVQPEPNAIYRLLETLENASTDVSLIYSDNDRQTPDGERYSPSFKPEWNEEMLLSGNYIGRFFIICGDLVSVAGGIRSRFGSSLEYDLLLRASLHTERTAISRIPEVLYSVIETDREDGCYVFCGTHDSPVLESFFLESNQHATVENGLLKGTVRVEWQLPQSLPSVDIIIPTRDRVDLLRTCIDSILEKTDYENYKITVVDNDSEESETHAYYESLAGEERFQLVQYGGVFNYSAINNYAVSKTHGSTIVLLNNDTEVIDGQWLSRLTAQSLRPNIGCVGAKLYYSSGLIQHAGVIVGVKGVAGHAHRFASKDDDGYCGRLKMSQNVSAVTAACLAVEREIYEKLGGLDEVNLKVAYNDVDFCLRVEEAGYRNVWTPHVELYHHESVSRGSDDTTEKARRFQSEFNYMQERWKTHLNIDPAYNPNLAHDAEDFSLAA